jgi:hypothetical protein
VLRIALASLRHSYVLDVGTSNIAIHALRLYLATDTDLASRIDVRTFETRNGSEMAELTRAIELFAPDVLGLSCYLWNTPVLVELAGSLRRTFPTCGCCSEARTLLPGPSCCSPATPSSMPWPRARERRRCGYCSAD